MSHAAHSSWCFSYQSQCAMRSFTLPFHLTFLSSFFITHAHPFGTWVSCLPRYTIINPHANVPRCRRTNNPIPSRSIPASERVVQGFMFAAGVIIVSPCLMLVHPAHSIARISTCVPAPCQVCQADARQQDAHRHRRRIIIYPDPPFECIPFKSQA